MVNQLSLLNDEKDDKITALKEQNERLKESNEKLKNYLATKDEEIEAHMKELARMKPSSGQPQ